MPFIQPIFRQFGGDPAALGRPLELPGRRLDMLVVVTDSHAFWRRVTVLRLPLRRDAVARSTTRIGNWSDLRVCARLAPGIATGSLAGELNGRHVALRDPDEMRDFTGVEVQVTPPCEQWIGERAGLRDLLLLAVMLVLLTSRANLTSPLNRAHAGAPDKNGQCATPWALLPGVHCHIPQ